LLNAWTQSALCKITLEMDVVVFFLNLQIKKALKGVRVEVTHRGDARRKYRIATLTQSGPSVME